MSVTFILKLLAFLAFCFLGLLVYSDTFANSFHFDDFPQIVDNHVLRNIGNIVAIWRLYPGRFIAYFSFALNYHWGGLNVWGYHILSLIIHSGVSLLVWQLTALTFQFPSMKNERISLHAPWIAFFTGLIFLVHPVQTQPINYIFQRAVLLAAFFYLESLLFYCKARLARSACLPVWKFYYGVSFVSAILSMMSKEIAITLPLMICFYEFYFLKRQERFKWITVAPFLAIFLLLPVIWQQPVNFKAVRMIVVDRGGGITVGQYSLTQLKVLVTYIRLVFVPIHQTVEYDYPLAKSIFETPVILSALFLLFILIAAVKFCNKFRLMAFGIFWFFMTLFPESSFWPNHDLIFEHRLYLPMMGFCIFLTSGFFYFVPGNKSSLAVRMLCILVLVYSVMAYQRNRIWTDEFSLWDDAVHQSPQSARAYLNRGAQYQKRGDLDHAMADYNMSIGLGPVTAVTLSNRGKIFSDKGEYGFALANFNLAIKINPGYVGTYVNRGTLYQLEGKTDLARKDFDWAITLDPNNADGYVTRGMFYAGIGNLDHAISDYNKALLIQPANPVIYGDRAAVYYLKNDYEKCWQDVHTAEALGASVKAEDLQALKTASGREH